MLKFSLLLLLLLAPHGVAARQGRTAQRPSRVAGTRVSLVPPAGFVPARRFPGYALEAEGASIMVTELPAPLDKVMPGFSDPEQLKARALTLLSKESVTRAGGAPAVLLSLRQTAAGAEHLKWVLLIGDEAGTAMVTATFPAAEAGRLAEPLRRSVLTATRDRSLVVPDDEGLPFNVAGRGALKPAGRMGHTLMFTASGRVPSPSIDDPLFVAAPSFGAAAEGDLKAFAERRVLQTASVKGVAPTKTEPFTADGLSGFETLADAKDAATGRPLVIYQAILFDGRDYYLMQGLVSRERAPEHLPSFKEMARSFRRR